MLAKWPLGAFSSPILAVLRLDWDIRFPAFANRKHTVLRAAANMVQLFVHWIQESTRKLQEQMAAPEVPTVSLRRKATAIHHLPQVQSLRSTDISSCTFRSHTVDGK
jgi:hypothetical protein